MRNTSTYIHPLLIGVLLLGACSSSRNPGMTPEDADGDGMIMFGRVFMPGEDSTVVVGAEVYTDPPTQQVRTQADGSFRLEVGPAGSTYRFIARYMNVEGSATHTVQPNDTRDVIIRLRQNYTIAPLDSLGRRETDVKGSDQIRH